MSDGKRSVVVLLGHDARRLAALVTRPSAGTWLGLALPAVLLALGVRAVGSVGGGELETTQGGVTLGVLIGGPVAFVAYSTLFRGGDDSFLRRLGIAPRSLFWERALRLLGWGGAVVILALLAYSAAGVSVGRILSVALPPMFAAWGGGLLAFSYAARAMAARTSDRDWGVLAMGMWDRDMAASAPLVHAPLLPLIAGGISGGVAAGVEESTTLAGGLIIALGLMAALPAAVAYGRALPRFGPQALEMSFAPRPEVEGGELRPRRGLARLLPRPAAAVWARDGAVAARRFGWAARVSWPVVIFSFVALARWGTHPGARGWVASAALLVLVLQGAASIGLGRLERRGPRWLDRALGVTPVQRFAGRWAWAWGLSLWMTVPLALAWSWWAEAGAGWPWLAVAAGTSAVAAGASMAAAGRR